MPLSITITDPLDNSPMPSRDVTGTFSASGCVPVVAVVALDKNGNELASAVATTNDSAQWTLSAAALGLPAGLTGVILVAVLTCNAASAATSSVGVST